MSLNDYQYLYDPYEKDMEFELLIENDSMGFEFKDECSEELIEFKNENENSPDQEIIYKIDHNRNKRINSCNDHEIDSKKDHDYILNISRFNHQFESNQVKQRINSEEIYLNGPQSNLRSRNLNASHDFIQSNNPLQHLQHERALTDSLLSQNAIDKTQNFQISQSEIDSLFIYIQTEICDETLYDYLEKRNRKIYAIRKNKQEQQKVVSMYQNEAYNIIHQIFQGLNYIHTHLKIIHRDIKPHNIFINSNLNVKIGDFGLVKSLQDISPTFSLSSSKDHSFEDQIHYIYVNQECSKIVLFKFHKQFKNFEKYKQLNQNLKVISQINSKSYSLQIILNSLSYIRKKLNQKIIFVNQDTEINLQDMYQTLTTDINSNQNEQSNEIETLYNNQMFTESCGTTTYSSPEQIEDKQSRILDYKTDIFPLALITLQLFYPMNTLMEITKTLSECRKGILPEEFKLENQEMAKIIQRMVRSKFTERPNLDEIIVEFKRIQQNFSFTKELGLLIIKFENQDIWQEKFCKVRNKTLYFYNLQVDLKAEMAYYFQECDIFIKNIIEQDQKIDFIEINNDKIISCKIKAKSNNHTQEIFSILNQSKNCSDL